MWVLCMHEERANVNVCVFGMRLGVCEEQCTGARPVLSCMLNASGCYHNKATIYDSCARKCKFRIIMKAKKKVELMEEQVH